MDFNRMMNGVMRAIRLDASFYNEVEADPSYQSDALIVVLIVSALGAIGAFLTGLIAGNIGSAFLGLVVSMVLGLVGYYILSFAAHFVGTKFFNGQGSLGEVQRALGFAYAPQMLNVFSFIPCVGGLIGLVALILMIATGFIAIRESLDQDNTNAALTMIIAGIVLGVVSAVVGAIFGVGFAVTSSMFGG